MHVGRSVQLHSINDPRISHFNLWIRFGSGLSQQHSAAKSVIGCPAPAEEILCREPLIQNQHSHYTCTMEYIQRIVHPLTKVAPEMLAHVIGICHLYIYKRLPACWRDEVTFRLGPPSQCAATPTFILSETTWQDTALSLSALAFTV